MKKRIYFGLEVRVTKYVTLLHPYPYRFSIVDSNGVERVFSGVPNWCETERSAFKRAWWRAKWMADGTYNQKYR